MTVQWPEEVELWKIYQRQRHKKTRRKKQRSKRNGRRALMERDAAQHMKSIREERG